MSLNETPPTTRPAPPKWLWPSWERRKRVVYVQSWFVVIAAYLALLPAWCFPQYWTSDSRIYLFFNGFFFMAEVFTDHLGLLLFVITAVAAWRRLKKLAFVALPLTLVIVLPLAWSYIPGRKSDSTNQTLRLVSSNLFWGNRDKQTLLDEILAEQPDVILLQEYSPPWHEACLKQLAGDYPYFVTEPRDDAFGGAIYSKLPFRGEPTTRLPFGTSDLPQIRAAVSLGGEDIAIYNVHLLPPISITYVMARNMQFASLLDELQGSPMPSVLVGDFNFTSTSPHARALANAGWRDAHDMAGYGRGATWPVNGIWRYLPIPGLRLDHAFLSRELQCTELHIGTGRGSDHRPITAVIGRNGITLKTPKTRVKMP